VMAKWLVSPYLDSSKIKAVKLSKTGLKRKWYIASLKNKDEERFKKSFIDHLKLGMQK
jgi:LysR family transcriptional regulator for metE and metH